MHSYKYIKNNCWNKTETDINISALRLIKQVSIIELFIRCITTRQIVNDLQYALEGSPE